MWHLLFRRGNWSRSPEISLRVLSSGMQLDKKVTRGIDNWILSLVTKGNHVSKIYFYSAPA
jgi:hypothetical protein